MSEITRITTVRITTILDGELEAPLPEGTRRKFAAELGKVLKVDNVVVTDVQDFVMD